MKCGALLFTLAASVAVAAAQSSPATPSTAHHTAPRSAAHDTSTRTASGIPPIHGIVKTLFSERYQDYKIGTGALAEPNKVYKVMYTGYLAATGQEFDSTDEHRAPEIKDGKPVTGADGKPVLGPPQPMIFPQGFGRLIPGFDQGFVGMRVGGKRRIFIPWELAYGTRNIPPHPPDHPGIPPKSDLIFDVELLDVSDMPSMPAHPPMGSVPTHPESLPAHPPEPAKPGTAAPEGTPGQPAHPATPPDANNGQPR